VQGIVELALEAPFELGVIEISGMEVEVISVNGYAFVFELNDHFDGVGFGTSREGQQGMLIEAQLGLNTFEAGLGHKRILAERRKSYPPACSGAQEKPAATRFVLVILMNVQ